MATAFEPTTTEASLTPDELQLLGLLAVGYQARQAAALVADHREQGRRRLQSLYAKLGVCSRDEAIVSGYARGYLRVT